MSPSKFRLTFVGTKASGIGLAFNNFSPTAAVPGPGGASLLGLGTAVTLVTCAHRRRRMRLAGSSCDGTQNKWPIFKSWSPRGRR